MNWVKKYGKTLTHAVEQSEKLSTIELDEFWSYVGVKAELAVDRGGKRVLGFSLGDYGAQTGDKLYKAISCLGVESYYADYWGAYESMLYKEQHSTSTVETYTVEGVHSLLRNYLARLQRKSQFHSKYVAMIAYSRNLLMNTLEPMRN
jgi:IS1 family transposase